MSATATHQRRRRHQPAVGRSINFHWQRPTTEMLTRVAWSPERQKLARPELRSDLAENLSRMYEAIWRKARATHRALNRTTWDQLAISCGYPTGQRAETQLRRYLVLLQSAGLITFGGDVWPDGRWRCLVIELVEPPSLRSMAPAGVAQSVQATVLVCEGRRLRETRAQRDARRRRPWRRCAGRAVMVERRALSWRPTSVDSLLEGGGPFGASHPTTDASAGARVGDARSGIDAPDGAGASSVVAASSGVQGGPPAAPVVHPTPTAAGENGEREQRATARRRRRAVERRQRLQDETRRMLRDGELVSIAERELYRQVADDADAERELYGRFADLLDSIPTDGAP